MRALRTANDGQSVKIQLPNYGVSSSGWPILREAQLQTTQIVLNTGLAITIDIGDPTYVHPSCRLGNRASGLSDTAAFALGLLLVLGARRNRRKQRSYEGSI